MCGMGESDWVHVEVGANEWYPKIKTTLADL